jgi:hypothetical protein
MSRWPKTTPMPSSLRENRHQDGVSEVHAVGIRKENNEDVKCVLELLQGDIDIRQGRQAKPPNRFGLA